MKTPTDDEREAIIASVVASQALAGVAVSREDAARWYDEAADDEGGGF